MLENNKVTPLPVDTEQTGNVDNGGEYGTMKSKHHPSTRLGDLKNKMKTLANRRPRGVVLVQAEKVVKRRGFPAFMALGTHFGIGIGIGRLEGWSVFDSFYFTITTLTTVGFGDLAPQTKAGRALCAIFIMYGLVLLTWAIAVVVDIFAEHLERIREQLHQQMQDGPRLLLHRPSEKKIDTHTYNLIKSVVHIFLIVTIGVLYFTVGEDFTFNNAFYFAIVTISTVGYGDIGLTSSRGRAFLCFYILFGTVLVAKAIGATIDSFFEAKRKAMQHKILEQRMSQNDLDTADADMSGSIGEAEFVLFKLQKMGLIHDEDLQRVKEQFRKIDVDNSGAITREEALAA